MVSEVGLDWIEEINWIRMEQSKMEQMLERLLASQHRMMAKMDAWLGGVTHACLKEEEEPAPEEAEAVAEPKEVSEGATDEETTGAAKDRSRDLRLAVGCRGQLRTRTKRDGGSRQECAAAVGRPTRLTAPAMRKRHVRRGPAKKCRSGIGGRGITSGNGMRGKIRERHRRLEGKKTYREVIRQSLLMEIAKLIFESSSDYGNRVTGYCGSAGLRRSGRGSAIAAPRGPTAIIRLREGKRRVGRGSGTESRESGWRSRVAPP
jgi:hypothetical protein